MGVLVEPKLGSYVTEWEAVKFNSAEYFSIKKILRGSVWTVQLLLTDDGAKAVCTTTHTGSMEQWSVNEGDWVVRSPHGRFWFMDEAEFRSNFHVWADGK